MALQWYTDQSVEFFEVVYDILKTIHKILIYMVKETPIKATCGRWHGVTFMGKKYIFILTFNT